MTIQRCLETILWFGNKPQVQYNIHITYIIFLHIYILPRPFFGWKTNHRYNIICMIICVYIYMYIYVYIYIYIYRTMSQDNFWLRRNHRHDVRI